MKTGDPPEQRLYLTSCPRTILPTYVDKTERIGCRQHNFEYVPQKKTHAMHYGKVFWGIKIAESNYNGTVVYFDWDVLPNENSAKALRNETILLACDTHNITTNWLVCA